MARGIGSEMVISVMASVPATAMIVTGHVWFGAATVGAVVAAVMLAARYRIRTEAASDREFLSYAHTATSLGADPAPVIKAMRHREDEDDDFPEVHLPPRRR
jgi:hypothetical protein